MSQPTKAMVPVTIRAKAFTGQGVKVHRAMVDDGDVRVYDPVAGYYTVCHCLSRATVRRIIRKLKEGRLTELLNAEQAAMADEDAVRGYSEK